MKPKYAPGDLIIRWIDNTDMILSVSNKYYKTSRSTEIDRTSLFGAPGVKIKTLDDTSILLTDIFRID